MKLFKYESYQLKISEEAFAIKAFRDIVKKDKSADKYNAMLELGYIYFMCDPRSDYMYITDEEERAKLIIEQEGLPKNWTPSPLVIAGIEVYKSLTTTTYSLLLDDVRMTIDKIRNLLTTMNLKETDDKGKPKFPVNMVVRALKDIPSLISQLAQAEKVINLELLDAGRMKANRQKKVGEDGLTNFV